MAGQVCVGRARCPRWFDSTTETTADDGTVGATVILKDVAGQGKPGRSHTDGPDSLRMARIHRERHLGRSLRRIPFNIWQLPQDNALYPTCAAGLHRLVPLLTNHVESPGCPWPWKSPHWWPGEVPAGGHVEVVPALPLADAGGLDRLTLWSNRLGPAIVSHAVST